MEALEYQEERSYHFLPALLVEDNVVCQMAIHSQLTHLGFQVQVSRYAPEEFRPWCPRNSFA
ncbi:hypothetical protein [Rickettsiella endosymbiont of Dermanyssus gallinae]|uniref:hypothetical protein n=1 Tax=Rickettsiella endosymbiont of Dermanyssus gallinae TaxID=2856608 RepID=UPI001C529968|nr:hypothetical protein [Rickettsiella endosymbiont of Dermanyssus gallinae]